jgi:hypothetical protein
MSLANVGIRAYSRLKESLCPKRIVFHHVPKCGGTSVGRSLRRAYFLSQGTVRPEESFRAYATYTSHDDRDEAVSEVFAFREMMLLYLLYSDIRCVAAHVAFNTATHEAFRDRYAFVTLLRDPVERFISHYFWSHRREGAYASITDELEDFLETPRARMLGCTYARYFFGSPPGTDLRTSPDTQAAIENLRRLDSVGFLDDVGHFERALRRLTGKRVRIGRENVGRHKSKYAAILEGPLRDKILEVCAPDREVWEAVQDLRAVTSSGGGGASEALSSEARWARQQRAVLVSEPD